MVDILRIKRRTSGGAGAPSVLANAELAYNETDHILYYGEGTGGGGGTASVIVGIAGQGLASTAVPLINGTAAAGTGTTWSRADHVHPTDTSRAAASAIPIASVTTPAMDGVAAVGVATAYSRGDHVHPTDTTRASTTSPVFTGTPVAPTAAPGTNTTQLATTAFVTVNFAPLASPSFTGTPTAPTAATGTNTTQLATTAFVLATRQDQQAVPTAAVSWNNQLLTNLAAPIANGDAANKLYVDQNSAGLSAKGSVAVATAGANITLSGLQAIDGYTTLASDRVLVKDQTLSQNNGIYVAAVGAWTRATDMDAWTEVPQAYVFVVNGTVNSNSAWVCNSAAGGTLGTTAIVWVQFSQAAQVTAGNGLTRTGNSFDVIGTSGRIAVFADNVDIDTAYIGQTSITTLGTVTTGTWNATTIGVARGGTGATTLTGFLKGNGTSAFTAQAQLATTDISGLGTMATQNANAVAITGGSIDGITLDGGSF